MKDGLQVVGWVGGTSGWMDGPVGEKLTPVQLVELDGRSGWKEAKQMRPGGTNAIVS